MKKIGFLLLMGFSFSGCFGLDRVTPAVAARQSLQAPKINSFKLRDMYLSDNKVIIWKDDDKITPAQVALVQKNKIKNEDLENKIIELMDVRNNLQIEFSAATEEMENFDEWEEAADVVSEIEMEISELKSELSDEGSDLEALQKEIERLELDLRPLKKIRDDLASEGVLVLQKKMGEISDDISAYTDQANVVKQGIFAAVKWLGKMTTFSVSVDKEDVDISIIDWTMAADTEPVSFGTYKGGGITGVSYNKKGGVLLFNVQTEMGRYEFKIARTNYEADQVYFSGDVVIFVDGMARGRGSVSLAMDQYYQNKN